MKKNLKKLTTFLTIILSIVLITGCTNTDNNSQDKSKTYGLNETFTFDDLEITIKDDITFTKVENEFSEYNDQTVVKLPITVKNLKSETHGLNMFYYKAYGANGTQLDSITSYFDDSLDFAGDLRSGASYTKYLYLLYDADGKYSLEFNNWSSKIIVEFNVSKN